MVDITIDSNKQPEAPEAVEVPKKPRKPRKKRVKAADVEVTTQPAKRTRTPKEDEPASDSIVHDGNKVTCTGASVKVRKMDADKLRSFGIKSVTGTLGAFCTSPVILTFSSPKLAFDFFDLCLSAEKKADEYIIDEDADWLSPKLSSIL